MYRSFLIQCALFQGETVAELMLNHSTHHECKDINTFKKELGELVNTFREDAISLNKVTFSTVCKCNNIRGHNATVAQLYVMVTRLPKVTECLKYFRCFCVVYGHVFVHK